MAKRKKTATKAASRPKRTKKQTTPKETPADLPPSASERLDQELAAGALRKRQAGVQPNSREIAALRRVEKREDEKTRWQVYRSIPKKHWAKMSGRTARTHQDYETRFGFPYSGAFVDLPRWLAAVYDWLGRNSRRLGKPLTEEELALGATGGRTPGQERLTCALADLRERDVKERDGVLVHVEKLAEFHGEMSARMRSAAMAIQKRFGQDAYKIIDEALVESGQIADRIFSTNGARKNGNNRKR